MRIWPGESNVDWSMDLYSSITGLVILSLAECVYINPLTCPYLLLMSCYWQLCQIYMFGPFITDQYSQISWQPGWLCFGRSWSTHRFLSFFDTLPFYQF